MSKQQPRTFDLSKYKTATETDSSDGEIKTFDLSNYSPKKKDDTELSGKISSTAGSSEPAGNPRQLFGMSYADWGKKYGAIGEFAADIADIPVWLKNVTYKNLLAGGIKDEFTRADRTKEEPDYDKLASLRKDINSVSLPKSIQENLDATDDPVTKVVKTIAEVALGSFAQSAGAYRSGRVGAAAGAIAGAGMTSWAGPFAGIGAASLGLGGYQAAASLSIEYGGAIADSMEEHGYNMTDPKSLHEAYNNKPLMDAAREKGIARGIPIAAIDLFTAGIGSKVGKVGLKLAEKTFLKEAEVFTEQATKKVVGSIVAVAEGAAGSIGEALGQLSDEGKISDLDAIGMEFFGDIGTGAPTIAYNYFKAAQINNRVNNVNSQKIQSLQTMLESLPENDETAPILQNKITELQRDNQVRNSMVVEALNIAPVPVAKKVLELTNQIESFDQKLQEFYDASKVGSGLTDEQRQQQKTFKDIYYELTTERDNIVSELTKAKEFETNINTPSPEQTMPSPIEVTKIQKAINTMTEFVGENLKAFAPTFAILPNGDYSLSVGKEGKPNAESTVIFNKEERQQRRELDSMLDEGTVTPEEHTNKVADLNKQIIARGIQEKTTLITPKEKVEIAPTTTEEQPQTKEFVYETAPEQKKVIFVQKFFADKRNENLTEGQIVSIEKAIMMGIEAGKSGNEIYGTLNALGFAPANVGGRSTEINLREYLDDRVSRKDIRTFQKMYARPVAVSPTIEVTKIQKAINTMTEFVGENLKDIKKDWTESDFDSLSKESGINKIGGDLYLTPKSNINNLIEKYGNFVVRVKDANGYSAELPANEYAEMSKNKTFSDRIKQVSFAFAGRNQGIPDGFMSDIRRGKELVLTDGNISDNLNLPTNTELVSKSTVSPKKSKEIIDAINYEDVQHLLRNLGIKKIVIEKPGALGLSEQGNYHGQSKTLTLSADLETPLQTILHEIGHERFENLSNKNKNELRSIASKDERVGYKQNLDEFIVDNFYQDNNYSKSIKETKNDLPIRLNSKQPIVIQEIKPEATTTTEQASEQATSQQNKTVNKEESTTENVGEENNPSRPPVPPVPATDITSNSTQSTEQTTPTQQAPNSNPTYTMDELFDEPDKMFEHLDNQLSDQKTAKQMGFVLKGYRNISEGIADNMITRSLAKAVGSGFVGITKIGNFSFVKINTKDKDGNLVPRTISLNNAWKDTIGYGENAIRSMFVKAHNSNNVAAKEVQYALGNIITNLTTSEGFQEARRELFGSKNNSNNLLTRIGDSLNNMIGNDKKALYRVHSLLDPEAFANEPKEGRPESVEDLSFSELRLFNTLRATNDFIHEWHYRNGFLDENTYQKNKGKYFARAYKEIEEKQYADIYDAINKAKAGAEFDIFKKRKDFSEIEDLTLSDPIYITIKRMGTMAHNKAIFDFAEKVANDTNYKSYSKLSEVPENNQKYYKKLNGNGNPKRFGDLTNKYVPIEIYEQLYGTQFVSQFVSGLNDIATKYDNMFLRQLTKKLKTVGSPLTRAANVISGFSFAMLGGVDPINLLVKKPDARRSLDSYDSWAQELTKAGLLGGQLSGLDIKKAGKESQGLGVIKSVLGDKAAKAYETVDQLASDTYGKVDDITKIAYYRTLVENYGVSKEEAIKATAKQMQNYNTVTNAFKLAAKLPFIGNAFIKFKPDSMRILYNTFKEKPIFGLMFVAMLTGLSKSFSKLSGESDEEREIRESRPNTTKFKIGNLVDINFGWKIGGTEYNVARYLSPYTMYDKGYRNNLVSDMSEYGPLQVQYLGRGRGIGGYMPKFSDPLLGPIVQALIDVDNSGLKISDPRANNFVGQTLSSKQQWFNRVKYVGRSWGTPYAAWAENMMDSFNEKQNYRGEIKDPLNAMLSIAVKNEKINPDILTEKYSRYLTSMDREVGGIINDWKSKQKKSLEEIDKIRYDFDNGKIKDIENRDNQIKNIKEEYSDLAIDLQGQMLEIVGDAKDPQEMLIKLQKLKAKKK